MDQEMKSLRALSTFRDNINQIEKFSGDGYIAKCKVTYKTSTKTESEILDVFLIIGGYTPMIKLDMRVLGKIITVDNYHMDFDPQFSKSTTFSFDPQTKTLIIEGKNSPKIGNYTVEIVEV